MVFTSYNRRYSNSYDCKHNIKRIILRFQSPDSEGLRNVVLGVECRSWGPSVLGACGVGSGSGGCRVEAELASCHPHQPRFKSFSMSSNLASIFFSAGAHTTQSPPPLPRTYRLDPQSHHRTPKPSTAKCTGPDPNAKIVAAPPARADERSRQGTSEPVE